MEGRRIECEKNHMNLVLWFQSYNWVMIRCHLRLIFRWKGRDYRARIEYWWVDGCRFGNQSCTRLWSQCWFAFSRCGWCCLHQYIQTQKQSPLTHMLYAIVITIHPSIDMSRYAASMAAPYPLGFIHLDLDGWTLALDIEAPKWGASSLAWHSCQVKSCECVCGESLCEM